MLAVVDEQVVLADVAGVELLNQGLPAEEASQVTIRATRVVLSAMCQMAFDEVTGEDAGIGFAPPATCRSSVPPVAMVTRPT